ncbi:MAG: alpha/beta hydrolase [Frankiaceae bacterium]|nr:alpha/beta hydrolase [Frankiaceae bacterium]
MPDVKIPVQRSINNRSFGLRGIGGRTADIDLATLPPGQRLKLPGGRHIWIRRIEGPAGAPTVVLLHGLFATADINWATSYAALIGRYTVVAIDQEGHGQGHRTFKPFRLERCADDVAAVCQALDITDPIVCGYSMGGPVAMLTWRRHPELVRGLVLCATVGRFNGGRRAELAGQWALARGTALGSLVPRQVRHQAMQRVLQRAERGGTNKWLIDQTRRQDLIVGFQAIAAILGFDSRPWIGEVNVPTAVVVTDQDQLLAPARQRALARAIPGAVEITCHADHATIVEADTPFPSALVEGIEHVATAAKVSTAEPVVTG